MRNGLDGMKAGIIQLLDIRRSDAVFLEEFEGLICNLFEKTKGSISMMVFVSYTYYSCNIVMVIFGL
jgi:hypothetical protein